MMEPPGYPTAIRTTKLDGQRGELRRGLSADEVPGMEMSDAGNGEGRADVKIMDTPPMSSYDAQSLRSLPTHQINNNPTKPNTAYSSNGSSNGYANSGVADFFSPEIFQIVLHNPTTSHQLLKFSQSRFCGENMEFLEKVGEPLDSIAVEING